MRQDLPNHSRKLRLLVGLGQERELFRRVVLFSQRCGRASGSVAGGEDRREFRSQPSGGANQLEARHPARHHDIGENQIDLGLGFLEKLQRLGVRVGTICEQGIEK